MRDGHWTGVVQAEAARWSDSPDEISDEVAQHIYASIPELAAGGDELAYQEMRRSTGSNVAALFSLAAAGRLAQPEDAPPQALEYARSLVRRGVALAALLRAYRLGHQVVWRRWSNRLAELLDGDELREALDSTSHAMFHYIDVLGGCLVQEYDAEHARWVRSASAARIEVARAILDGEPVDVAGASATLSYELRRHHIGLVLWLEDESQPDTLGGLERVAAELAAASGFPGPLLLPVTASVLWGWIGSRAEVDGEALDEVRSSVLPRGMRAALGEPAAGVDGFRHTHEEALQAHRLACLAPRGRRITRYRSVEIESLLSVDLPRTQRFVDRELGELAGQDDTAARLRATLQVLFDEGGNRARTARRLGVHENTITYRITQAETLLGRSISERPFALQSALALVGELGDAVLPRRRSAERAAL